MPLSWNEIKSRAIGNYYVRLPLRKTTTTVPCNAAPTNWLSLIDRLPWQKGMPKYDYILGNPTFIGRSLMNAAQKADINITFNGVNAAGVLYIKV